MDDFLDKLPEMDLMRSEKMTLVQLIIPVESAHRCVTYLGELGLLQFRDVSVQIRLLLLSTNRSESVAFRLFRLFRNQWKHREMHNVGE